MPVRSLVLTRQVPTGAPEVQSALVRGGKVSVPMAVELAGATSPDQFAGSLQLGVGVVMSAPLQVKFAAAVAGPAFNAAPARSTASAQISPRSPSTLRLLTNPM